MEQTSDHGLSIYMKTPVVLLVIIMLTIPSSIFAAGDVDGDTEITAYDASLILQIVAGTYSLDTEETAAADADGDGEITSDDARLTLQWASQETDPVSDQGIDLTESISAATISSASGAIGSDGGSVSLSTGEQLAVPVGILEETVNLELRKVDVGDLNPVGNQTWYALYPDISEFSGVTLTIPYSELTLPESGGAGVEAVGLLRYDPLTRNTNIVSATFEKSTDNIIVTMSDTLQTTSYQRQTKDMLLSAKSAVRNSTLYILVADAAGSMVQSQDTMRLLDVPHYEQGLYNYCWATSTAMLTNYHLTPDDTMLPWRKPQDFARAMNIHWNSGGLSFASLYLGSSFSNYLQLVTDIEPEISVWPISFASLRLYVKQQIMDHNRPVMLFLPQHSHFLAVTGYELRNGKPYVYINNPSMAGIGIVDWEILVDPDGISPHSAFTCSVIFPTAGSGAAPVSINIMGHKDIEPNKLIGMSFKHPDADMPDNANLRYSWYEQPPGEYCMLTKNGESGGQPTIHIPDYYEMELYARVTNRMATTINANIEWQVSCTEEATPTYSGTQNGVSIGGRNSKNFLFRQTDLDDLTGDCAISVEISNTSAPYNLFDRIDINATFGEGIRITAGSGEGEIQWTAYQGTFSHYKVMRRKVGDNWGAAALNVAADMTSWTDTNWPSMEGDYEYAVMAMQDVMNILMTSDIYQTTANSGDRAVIFPDTALDEAIRDQLYSSGIVPENYTDDIMRSQLAQLEQLTATYDGIVDLTGLEYCTNLRNLTLRGHNIVDISAIAALTQLTTLDLEGNDIVDVSHLSGLSALRDLVLQTNDITNISPLSGITTLEDLDLTNNDITSLEALSGLTNLTRLEIGWNDIDSLSPISGLAGLTLLDTYSNDRLSDIGPVSGLVNLTWIRVGGCPITSLGPLSGLTSLNHVSANSTQITSISPLVSNSGIGEGDSVYVEDIPGLYFAIDCDPANGDITFCTDVQTLESRGVTVHR